MMRVLVTGGTSLLGRLVATNLLARGDAVTLFQRRPAGLETEEILGDLRDSAAVAGAVEGHDAIIHLAALVAPRPRWVDAVAVNVDGTANVLAAARGVGRFVHISSPSVAHGRTAPFGAGTAPATYAGPDRYTATKALAEQLVLERATVPTVVLRPHLVWGPGDTQLVGRLVDRARSGRLVLPGRGTALVDTTYVDDAAAAIVAGLDRATPGSLAVGRPWTVTGGDPRPVGELVAGILAAVGVEARVRSVPTPIATALGWLAERCWIGDEPPLTRFAVEQLSSAHWFDQRATTEALSWRPTVTVDEGLQRLAAGTQNRST